MAIPDYQTLMLPLLKELKDGNEHYIRDVIFRLAEYFKLSNEERQELQPSGSMRLFDNRVHWARKYLKEAGLIDAPKRGHIIISNRGNKVLAENPGQINNKYLKQFDEFREFKSISNKDLPKESEITNDILEKLSPEDALNSSYKELSSILAKELLSTIRSKPPDFFEKLVLDLLKNMGYGTEDEDSRKTTRKTGDEGIDGVISEDKLGLDIIYIQAKRWIEKSSVGRPDVQKFVGALHGQRAKKGIIITTSKFTSEAYEYIQKIEPKVVLIDGAQLSRLMIEYGIGVTEINTLRIRKIDMDYFEDD